MVPFLKVSADQLVARVAVTPLKVSYGRNACRPNRLYPPVVLGFCRGLLAPLCLLASLAYQVRIYEWPNGGWWYDLGFVAGILAWGGAGAAARKKFVEEPARPDTCAAAGVTGCRSFKAEWLGRPSAESHGTKSGSFGHLVGIGWEAVSALPR